MKSETKVENRAADVTSPPPQAKKRRLNHIDAIRGSVMLLLVPYHGLRFLQNQKEDIFGLDFGVFWLHLWRMGLFFAVSGLLAAMTLSLWGASRQVKHRLMKIGIPLAVGMVTIMPLQKLISYGYRTVGNGKGMPDFAQVWEVLWSWKPNHLWFLSYLLVMNIVAVVIWLAIKHAPQVKVAADSLFRKLVGSWLLLPVLALSSGGALLLGNYRKASGEVASSLIPIPSLLLYYAIFFVFGWMIYRHRDQLGRVEGRPWLKLAGATIVSVVAYAMFTNELILPGPIPHQWAILFFGSLAAWMNLFAVWGLFAKYLGGAKAWVRYLADAAYWVYLIHVPFLIFIQLGLARTELPALLRFALATSGALVASFVTYQLFVRHTALGDFFHGPRERKKSEEEAPDGDSDDPDLPSMSSGQPARSPA